MKASELIEILRQLPDLTIVVDGYEDGTVPLQKSNIVVGYVDTIGGRDWWEGAYGNLEAKVTDMEEPEHVILLSR